MGTRVHGGLGTDTIPGKAAALYETKTYSDQANFVPFIVEKGGRINAAGLQFLSANLPLEAECTAGECGGSTVDCGISLLKYALART